MTASGRSTSSPRQTADPAVVFGGVASDQDYSLKLSTAAALASAGYFCQINVNLSATSERDLADVTDADVLAIRHDPTFVSHIVAVSCKSGEARSLSPAKEIFYLKGVLSYLGADEGVAIFSRKAVPPHLRDLGRQLGILALSGQEADNWLKGLTNGLPDYGYFSSASHEEAVKALRAPAATNIVEWLAVDYWFYKDFRNIHRIVGKLGKALDGNAPWHTVVFLQAAAHLSLTVLDLCRHVQMLGVSRSTETTPAYLFGGATSYRGRRELHAKVQQVLRATSGKTSAGLPPLEPPYTGALGELALRFLERPQAAIRTPQALQDRLWRELGSKGLPPSDSKLDLAVDKLAQDLLDFMKNAAGGPWAPSMFLPVSGDRATRLSDVKAALKPEQDLAAPPKTLLD